ncbi:MAG: DUF3515 domain-containing protein [Cryobacterium sp.]|nr:DUF3515 domain-containing protein [Cryobacterium sp.]
MSPSTIASPRRSANCANLLSAPSAERTFGVVRQRVGLGRGRIAAAVAALTLLALTGCTPTVTLEPAADATNPECAEVIVWLPDTVDDKEYRYTDAQGTGAWGEPAAVLLRCGVPVPGPSTLPCVTLRGVDWLRDDSDAPVYIFTTYGREPAVEVIVDSTVASGTNALVDLANSVGRLPKVTECVDPEDVFELPEPDGG